MLRPLVLGYAMGRRHMAARLADGAEGGRQVHAAAAVSVVLIGQGLSGLL
jgi:hypothetical protein